MRRIIIGLPLALLLIWSTSAIASTTPTFALTKGAIRPVPLSTFRLPTTVTGPSHFFASDGGGGPQVPPADYYDGPQTLADLGTYQYGVTPNVAFGKSRAQAYYEVAIYKTVEAAQAANAENRDGATDGNGQPLTPLTVAQPVNGNEWLGGRHAVNVPDSLFCSVASGIRYQNVRAYSLILNFGSEAATGHLPCTEETQWASRVMRFLYPKLMSYVAAHPPLTSLKGPTAIRIIEPFDRRGHLLSGYAPASSGLLPSGSCTSFSFVTGRSDAYRCIAGSAISDPCFAPPVAHPSLVACVIDPRVRYAELLHLVAALPNQQGHTPKAGQGQPWAFDLATAEQCGFESGATKALDDLRLNYGCSPGASVYGDVTRTGGQWTAFVWRGSPSATPTRSQLIRVGVLVAYF